jgi:hypothetical protein
VWGAGSNLNLHFVSATKCGLRQLFAGCVRLSLSIDSGVGAGCGFDPGRNHFAQIKQPLIFSPGPDGFETIHWMLPGHFWDASGTPPGRYAWTVSKSVLLEVNRGPVLRPPNFGRPMAVQKCAHWLSAGTRGVVTLWINKPRRCRRERSYKTSIHCQQCWLGW